MRGKADLLQRLLRDLFRGGDFVDDGLRGGAGVRGSGDRAAYDQEIGAGFDGFRGSRGAGLVVGLRGGYDIFLFRANAGSYDQKIASAGFSYGAGFLHRGNYAIHSGGLGQLCEFHDAALRGSTDSDFAHRFLIHAGQDRDGEESRAVRAHGLASANGLHCRVKHRVAAKRVYVYKLDARHRGG